MPPIWPSIQLLGSCLGQLGSTLNSGPSATAGGAPANVPTPTTKASAMNLAKCVFLIVDFPNFRGGEYLQPEPFAIIRGSLEGILAVPRPAYQTKMKHSGSNP